jgi:hypothetical protein
MRRRLALTAVAVVVTAGPAGVAHDSLVPIDAPRWMP